MSYENVKNELVQAKSMEDVLSLIDRGAPGWVLGFVSGFSPDYQFLADNWNKVCEKNGVSPTQLVIVRTLESNDEEIKKIYDLFAAVLTSSGFLVRRIVDIHICGSCKLALPSQGYYETIVQNKEQGSEFNIPETWSSKCSSC